MSWGLITNSLLVAGCATVLAGLAGALFAIFAASLPSSGRNFATLLGVASLILPPFLVSNAWLNYFGLNGTWRAYIDFNVYSLPGTILLLALLFWPVSFLAVLASLLRIDPAYLEQEPLLRGAKMLRYVAWPICRPALAFALLLTFVLALNNFSIPTLLQTKVFAAEVWLSFNTKFDYAEALRLSWPLIAAPLLLLALCRFRPVQFAARTADFPTKLWRLRLGMLFALATAASAALLLLSLGLPLGELLANPRTWSEFFPAIEAGKSAALNSLLLAFLPALIVLGLGMIAAKYKAGATGWLFFLTPGVVIGIGLIRVFNQPALAAFYQGIGIVLLGFSLRYFALGWSGARAALARLDRAPSEVVAVLGGSRWQRLLLAEWPQARNVLLSTFFLVYLLCLWEVETLILIVPPGRETLALRVFNMLHYGHAGQVDALCVWMLAFGVAPLALWAMTRGVLRKLAPVAMLILLCGCSGHPSSGTKLDSKIFSSVQVFGTRGTGAGQFNKPRSIAVDRNDNFYVVDLTGRVQKFSPDGKYLLSWQMPQTDKGKPKGMGRDIDGNIIVVEPHYSRVNHFTPEGKLVAQWGVNGTNEGQLYFPRCVAINSRGEMYLAEYGMVERIQHFSHLGTNFLGSIGKPGTGPGELNRGEGVCVGPDDTLFEADSCNHRVQIFSPEGKLLGAFGSPGSGPNEMSYPYDICIDKLGYRYVCEFGNSRVQIFDAQNRCFEILGGAGADPGQMNNPWAIALDSHGNLYVADALNHRIQKFIRRTPLAAGSAESGLGRTGASPVLPGASPGERQLNAPNAKITFGAVSAGGAPAGTGEGACPTHRKAIIAAK